MDEEMKEEIKEIVKEEIAAIEAAGSAIDDKVEETAAKYQIPKWAVWLSGAVVVGMAIKILF